MLPTSLHDANVILEVSIPIWQKIVEISGDPHFLNGEPLSHEQLNRKLAGEVEPGATLIHALDVIHTLGTDEGRHLIENVVAERQLSFEVSDDVSSRELAANLWILSNSNAQARMALTLALASASGATTDRLFREFAATGEDSMSDFDEERIKQVVTDWCQANGKTEAIDVYSYTREGMLICEIIRSEPIKGVVEIRDKHTQLLYYRPASSDVLRYDVVTGRVGIATRSPKLIQEYRKLVGSLVANDSDFFSDENICSLEPFRHLEEGVFANLPHGIVSINVSELHWQCASDHLIARGKNCFKLLKDRGATLSEGALIEAKLSIRFEGVGKRGVVSIKVPNRIDINAGVNQPLVESLLDRVGIRGSFGDEDTRRNFWSLYPWRMSEKKWRSYINHDFDSLLRRGVLRATDMEIATHPDHPQLPGLLHVAAVDERSHFGISSDPAIPGRMLTPTDFSGYEPDILRVVSEIAKALKLQGESKDVYRGLWLVGLRTLSCSTMIAVFVATRALSDDILPAIRVASGTARAVILVPTDCSCDLDFPQVKCRILVGPHEDLISDCVMALGLQDGLSLPEWRCESLLVDRQREIIWYHGAQLTHLKADTHAFKFAVALAESGGTIPKSQLNDLLSPSRKDDEAAKHAKSFFKKAARESFQAKGLDCPIELDDIFPSTSGGYRLNESAYVL